MQHPLMQLAQDVPTGHDRQYFWGFVIPAVASVLGNLAGGRASGRQAAASTNLSRDQLATQQYQTQQNALLSALIAAANQQTQNAQTDLARRNYTLTAPNQRASTAVRGDILSRSRPLSIDFQKGQIPRFSGGPSLADLSPESKQLGQSITRNALVQQLKGDEFDPLQTQNFQGAILTPPGQTPLPKENWFDKFLNVAAPIAGVAGAVTGGMQEDRNQALIQQLLEQAMRSSPSGTLPANPIPGWSYGVGN